MTFLKALVPLLPTAATFQLHLSNKEGKLHVLLLPQLAPAPDEEDPGVAALRGVLASAIKLVVPAEADPDAYILAALTDLAAVRGEAVSELDAYRTALSAAKDAAKAADEARRKEASAKASSKATKPAKGASAPVAPLAASNALPPAQGDDDEAGEEASDDPATDASDNADDNADDNVSTTNAPPPATAGQSNLFADLGL
jgi:hypothetical protein